HMNAFDASQVAVLRVLADQAAVGIENARLFSTEQKRRLVAAALADLAKNINAVLDLDEVMQIAFDRLQMVISYDSSSILLVEGEDLVVRACQGFEDPQKVVGLH